MRIRFCGCLILLTAALAQSGLPATAVAQSPDPWRDDLRFLVSEVERLHPRPWVSIARAEFLAAADALTAAAPTLSEDQRVVRLMQLVSLLRDGHTRVHPTLPDHAYTVFPLRLFLFADGLFVTVAAEQHTSLLGAEVLRIGGVQSLEVFRRLETLASGDNRFYAAGWAPESLVFSHLLRGLGIIGSKDVLPLELRLRDGSLATVEIGAVPWDSRSGWFWWPFAGPAASPTNVYRTPFADSASTPLFLNREKKRYWFQPLPELGAMYLYFQSFADLPDEPFVAFQQRMFDAIDAQGLSKLIIDLRWNAGGNGSLIWPLIYNIIKRDRLNATGNVFVITGRNSFSASVLAVASLRTHAHAITVGEPMAAPYNASGDPTHVTLPNTGYRVSISELYWQYGFPGDRRRAQAPDVLVAPRAADYFAGRDPFLAPILAGEALDLEQVFAQRGVAAGLRRYREVLAAFTDTDWEPWSEREVHDVGRNLRRAGKLPEAIAVYTLNTEAHPESWNAWDDLGNAYLRALDLKRARACVEKSLRLNPGSGSGRAMLAEITEKEAASTAAGELP
jgi:hypothetical protein